MEDTFKSITAFPWPPPRHREHPSRSHPHVHPELVALNFPSVLRHPNPNPNPNPNLPLAISCYSRRVFLLLVRMPGVHMRDLHVCAGGQGPQRGGHRLRVQRIGGQANLRAVCWKGRPNYRQGLTVGWRGYSCVRDDLMARLLVT